VIPVGVVRTVKQAAPPPDDCDVPKKRSATQEQIAELLNTARESLQLSVAFLSRLDGTTQHLEVVEGSKPAGVLFPEGWRVKQETSFCQGMLDGKLPSVMPNVTDFPEAMRRPAAKIPRIRSFVTVPIHLSDGSLYGTFCAAGLRSDKELSKRDESLMRVLAGAAAVILEPEIKEKSRVDEILGRLDPLIATGGPNVVLQPIVDLATGLRVGAEALSRFPAEWGQPPDVVFEQAHSVDRGHLLELLALERAARHLDAVDGYVTMNVSPATLLTPECRDFLVRLPHQRVVLELSEHDPVEDYDLLRDVIAPYRAAGMRLAIDDVGAGFSSLKHIVLTAPDVLKLDRSLVTGLGTDPVRQTLVRSLTDFGHGSEATIVAEGVETVDDATTLLALGVDYGQGWYHGRPGPPEALSACTPVADTGNGEVAQAPVPQPRAAARQVSKRR
jgi:EAL domain-containing protein (putative c-di-GMP-specific phosphodiesterase class I)